MIKKSLIFGVLLALAGSEAAGAQERAPCDRLACSASIAESPGALRINELVNSPRELPRTYWLEGGIAGAIGLGLFTAVLYGGLCESQSCTGSTIAGAAFGGAVGLTIGALVGGQFRKGPRDTTSAH